MKIINKLKFLFKKITLKESEYNTYVYKANCYDNMISCVHMSVELKSMDVKNGKGNATICRFEDSKDVTCFINIIDMLEAGGFTFNKEIKWNIITEEVE